MYNQDKFKELCLFEINDKKLRSKIVDFFERSFIESGADSVRIICDETNNSDESIANSELRVDVKYSVDDENFSRTISVTSGGEIVDTERSII